MEVVLAAVKENRKATSNQLAAQTKQLESTQIETELAQRDKIQKGQESLVERIDLISLANASENDTTRTMLISEIHNAESKERKARVEDICKASENIRRHEEQTRADIIHSPEVKHEILKQRFEDLEEAILNKTQELRDVILSTSAAQDEASRRVLQSRGQSLSVILMSLRALYDHILVNLCSTVFSILY